MPFVDGIFDGIEFEATPCVLADVLELLVDVLDGLDVVVELKRSLRSPLFLPTVPPTAPPTTTPMTTMAITKIVILPFFDWKKDVCDARPLVAT